MPKRKMTNRCNRKIYDLDRYIQDSEKTWTPPASEIESVKWFQKQVASFREDIHVRSINIQEGSAAHAIILVKYPGITKYNIAIFEPNSAKHLPFLIMDGKKDVTKTILNPLSPKDGINNAVDENPGLCNIFGITFMTYIQSAMRKGEPLKVWQQKWKKILACLEKKEKVGFSSDENKKVIYTNGLDFALSIFDRMEQESSSHYLVDISEKRKKPNIVDLLKEYCGIETSPEPVQTPAPTPGQ